jgi:hypothetical protein
VLAEARQLSSWTQEKENNVKKLFFQKFLVWTMFIGGANNNKIKPSKKGV